MTEEWDRIGKGLVRMKRADRHPITFIIPDVVYRRLAAISQASGVPRNSLVALAVEFWLRRFEADEPVARAFASREEVYTQDGNKRDLDEIADRVTVTREAHSPHIGQDKMTPLDAFMRVAEGFRRSLPPQHGRFMSRY